MGMAEEPELMGIPMKHVSLITLTFQNSALILIMHYSRTMPLIGNHRYFTSTAVFLNEVIKLALSLTIALYDISRTLPPSTPATVLFEQLWANVFYGDGWKLAIPAVLYTLQNSLQYVAISNLDAVHFQILYQLKILTTALFSMLLLRRSLSAKKWTALVLLTIGVAIVQLPSSETPAPLTDHDSRFYFPRSFHELGQLANGAVEVSAELTKRGMEQLSEGLSKRSATYEGIDEDQGLTNPAMNYSLGCTSVIFAAIISGLTGVYFEKVLKEPSSSNSSGPVSIWTRNVQLSFYSLFPSLLIGVLLMDGAEIAQRGFFDGYNGVVWTAIGFQAVGGVLVSMCIHYADNIAKNFATSISIILSFLFSVWVFDFPATASFLFGTALVILSTYLYSDQESKLSSRRGRPPPIMIANYEKTTIDNGFTPQFDEDKSDMVVLKPVGRTDSGRMEELRAENSTLGVGLSTSRPSSPMRHHHRVGSSRGKVKRDD